MNAEESPAGMFAGLLTSGQGGVADDNILSDILLGGVMGAMAGLMVGFIVSKLMRFITMMRGKRIGRNYNRTVLACMFCGCVALAVVRALSRNTGELP